MPITPKQKEQLALQRKRVESGIKRGELSKGEGRKLLKKISPLKKQTILMQKEIESGLNLLKAEVASGYKNSTNAKQYREFLKGMSLESVVPKFNSNEKEFIKGLNEWHETSFYGTLNKSIGIDVSNFISEAGLGEKIDDIVSASAESIKEEVFEDEIERIETLVRNSIVSGTEYDSLENEIMASFDVAKNKAKFIARDQTQRVINSLNKFRQEAAGIKKYKWITSKDNRVRSSHAIMEGLEVEWETGKIVKTPSSVKRQLAGKSVDEIANGHVGSDYNCRCSAVAILEV